MRSGRRPWRRRRRPRGTGSGACTDLSDAESAVMAHGRPVTFVQYVFLNGFSASSSTRTAGNLALRRMKYAACSRLQRTSAATTSHARHAPNVVFSAARKAARSASRPRCGLLRLCGGHFAGLDVHPPKLAGRWGGVSVAPIRTGSRQSAAVGALKAARYSYNTGCIRLKSKLSS